MRILTLSSVFPNPKQPVLGVFVRERMRRVARHSDVLVVAPVPWFPLNARIRGPRSTGIPEAERQEVLRVLHPRFFCVPRYMKWLDGLLYAGSLLPFLARVRREFPFDLIDAHFAYPDGLAASILGRIFRCPVVITLRGSIVRLATYPLHRPQLRLALGGAARVIAVSQALKETAVGLGVPAGKIRVIPNGVDTARFIPMDRAAARRELGLSPERRLLLSVGGLNEGKGHHRIVKVLPKLLERYPDLLFVVVGGGRHGDPYRTGLHEQIAHLGLQNHVMVAGEWPHASIPRWMASADLFCLATRSEGWANVLLEAMACGLPVVTTRVGGNPEIVTNERVGILVPSGDDDALARGILDGLGRSWDMETLMAHARVHSWDATSDAVLEEFGRLINSSGVETGLDPLTAQRVSGAKR